MAAVLDTMFFIADQIIIIIIIIIIIYAATQPNEPYQCTGSGRKT
jgi:hypothetical protein